MQFLFCLRHILSKITKKIVIKYFFFIKKSQFLDLFSQSTIGSKNNLNLSSSSEFYKGSISSMLNNKCLKIRQTRQVWVFCKQQTCGINAAEWTIFK